MMQRLSLVRFGQTMAMVLMLAGLFGPGSAQAQQGYRVLDTPQPTDAPAGAVEVREFFSYGCPHCADFEPVLGEWSAEMGERIEVVHTPVTFGRESWAVLARAYYAAQALGILDQTHAALFEAIHEEGRSFTRNEDVAAFYASVADVSEADVLAAMNSFAVNTQLNRGERLVNAYRVPGTPALGVAGRYLIDVRAAGGQQGMLDVAESLVVEENGDQ
ncbi:thiol:disulfide interchange protein DsbA/DsbL [Spiribacter sp. 221]|uniref:thiol:disulfide interchange protein DsbA/DsbL n=1 Tax=Spiribacter onubensis TaxID=3122420 RepID=UPI00349FAD02